MRAKLKRYVVTCSADAELNPARLYAWGQLGATPEIPQTKKEAKRMIERCKCEMRCFCCDAELHEIVLDREKKYTKLLYG